jgi:hypothetical protein
MQQEEEEQGVFSHLSLVPYQSPYPTALSEETIEFFKTYDDGDQSEDGVQHLTMTLARDIEYLHGRVEDPRDPQLYEIRTEQAMCLQKHFQRINNVLLCNMLYLGRLLIEANERALYSYLGYPSLEVWCESLHVEPAMLKKAKQLADLWPWLRQFGYSIYEVVDGKITEEKVRILQRLLLEKKNERGIQAIAVYSERYGSPMKEEEVQETRKLSRAVMRAIDLLPEEEQADIQEEVQERYIAQMRDAIEHIRELSIGSLKDEKNELMGLTSKPYILINCVRRGKEMDYHGTFTCGTAEILSFISNQVIYQYKIDDRILTASQFGEYLNEHELPDWQD